MKPGDIIKFKEIKDKGDELAMFEVLELRGEHVLVIDVNKQAISPTFVYLIKDLEIVK